MAVSAGQAGREAIEAAVRAPPVHNTKPWRFTADALPGGTRIGLHATAERFSAALRTRALEVPAIRDLIRRRTCRGLHPRWS